MKKLTLFLLLTALSMNSAFASNYLTLCENDTLRISPNRLYQYIMLPLIANFDGGVADNWRFEYIHPVDMEIDDRSYDSVPNPNNGLHIPYIKSDGTEDIYAADLTVLHEEEDYGNTAKRSVFESTITQPGYWDPDNDGIYESYGTVKWGPGHYDQLFGINFYLNNDCTGDSIVINWLITSSNDLRYPNSIISYDSGHRVIHISIRYLKGDVNGDEQVNIYDVTALIDHLSDQLQGMDQYQLDAADVNNDGEVSIADVTRLLDILLLQGTLEIGPGDTE